MAANPEVSGAAAGNPLSPAQLQLLSQANQRVRKIRFAARIAGFNAWCFAVFAVLSLPFAFFSLSTLVMTIGLGILACNEFRGQRRLNRLDPRACRLLGWNQIGFLILLIGYCVWSILTAFRGANPLASYPELQELVDLQSIGDIYRQVTLAVYGGVIVGSVLFQGGNALYYFTRERVVCDYLSQTEPWIVELQKSTT